MMMLLSLTASAQTFEYKGIVYNIVSESDKTVEVASKPDVWLEAYQGDVVIPSYVTNNSLDYKVIGLAQAAFYRCIYITSVTLPNTIQYIRKEAFSECFDMKSITIPESVIEYGFDVFCVTGLEDITVLNPIPVEITYGAFVSAQMNGCVLHVPKGSGNAYRNAEEWNKFETIIEIGSPEEIDPNQEWYMTAEKDWQNCDEFDIFEHAFSSYDQSVTATAEGLAIYNPNKSDLDMLPSTIIIKNLTLNEDGYYYIRIYAKIPSDGQLVFRLYNGTDTQSTVIDVVGGNDYQIIDAYFPRNSVFYKYSNVELLCGNIAGTIIVQKVQAFGTIPNKSDPDNEGETEDNPRQDYETHEYVDLGLPSGNLWAKTNVGAEREFYFGNHYAYGETSTKEFYYLENYKWYDKEFNMYTKYSENYSDRLTQLLDEDDVAAKLWKDNWHIPSYADYTELIDNCSSIWEEYKGVMGRRFTGLNGNSIFFPASGYKYSYNQYRNELGYYLTSISDMEQNCILFYFSDSEISNFWLNVKYQGYSVRPVIRGGDTSINGVDNNKEELDQIYNIQGVRMKELSKGLNIIKMKNGKTRKIIMK